MGRESEGGSGLHPLAVTFGWHSRERSPALEGDEDEFGGSLRRARRVPNVQATPDARRARLPGETHERASRTWHGCREYRAVCALLGFPAVPRAGYALSVL